MIARTFLRRPNGGQGVAETPQPSAAELHKRWVALENEQHQLAIAIDAAKIEGVDPEPMRQQQARLLLEINALVFVMKDAPVTKIDDFVALVDVALEHELDLASDISFYGPIDYPMTSRLLRALAHRVPGFEFNSLLRWLSSPGQFEELMGNAAFEPSRNDTARARRNSE
jgi:hypothetical protein